MTVVIKVTPFCKHEMPKQKDRKGILLHSNQSDLTFQILETKLSYLHSDFFCWKNANILDYSKYY